MSATALKTDSANPCPPSAARRCRAGPTTMPSSSRWRRRHLAAAQLADRLPCERARQARRLCHARHAGRARLRDARRGRRGAGLPQCLPPSRRRRRARRHRPLQSRHPLLLSRLDLRARRPAEGAAGRGHLPRPGQGGLRPEAAGDRNLAWASCSSASCRRRPVSPSAWRPITTNSPPTASRRWCRSGRAWDVEIPVDWKNVMDNYPRGLSRAGRASRPLPAVRQQLRGRGAVRAMSAARSAGCATRNPPTGASAPISACGRSRRTSEAEQRQSWRYYTMLPNFAFDVYPEQMDFFHIIPMAPGKSRMRGRIFGLPADDRADARRALARSAASMCEVFRGRRRADRVRAGRPRHQRLRPGLFLREGDLPAPVARHDARRRSRSPPVEPPEPGTVAAQNARLAPR